MDELLVELEELAASLDGERAAWTWYRCARLSFDQADLPRTLRHVREAFAALGETPGEPALAAALSLLFSEALAELGDPQTSARLSLVAEAGFRAAGDELGFLAVWVTRAERALLDGDADLGVDIVSWILPRLDALAPRWPRVRLRLIVAAWYLERALPADARRWAEEAAALTAPGSAEAIVAAAARVRALLDLRDPHEAVAVATSALEPAAIDELPAARAELTMLLAAALVGAGEPGAAQAAAEAAGEPEGEGFAEARLRYQAAGARHAPSRVIPSVRRNVAPGKVPLTIFLPVPRNRGDS